MSWNFSLMLHSFGRNLRLLWRPLVSADLLFKAVAFTVLTPTITLLLRGFLLFSGQTVLSDTDIARFLIDPIGWLAMIVVGGAVVGVLALEQSVLMAIISTSKQEQSLSVLGSFKFVAAKAAGIFQIAARMVARIFVLSAPFLVVGGGLYLLLLTKHDINYYLNEQPPQYWLAMVLIGIDAIGLAIMLVRCVVGWSIAYPLYLFEGVPPRECLITSRDRVHRHRGTVTKWILIWLVVNGVFSSVATALVLALGRSLIPTVAGQLWALIFALGMVLVLLAAVNLLTSLLAVVSFAMVQIGAYHRYGQSSEYRTPINNSYQSRLLGWWSRRRAIAALVIAVLTAGLIGVTAIHSIRLNDHVEVTAHRGASANAPENTIAAVRRAIQDEADWVEIDVQESKDGVVVVAHDSDLMKVSGVATKIWQATAEELQTIDIGSYFGQEFKSERVPTLASVLEECRGRVGLNIELKYYGHDQNLEHKVVQLVEQYDMASDVVIMSMKSDGIRKIKSLRPTWKVGLLTAVKVGDLTRVEADFLAVNTRIATHSFIQSAHSRDKPVHVWTVNDVVSMSTMISRGADNLITDRPELARRVLRERATMSPVERLLLELALLFDVVSIDVVEQ